MILKKFVILSMPRSGSSYLYTKLNSHPSMVVHGELFKPRGMGALSGKLRQNRKLNLVWLNQRYRERYPLKFLAKAMNFDKEIDCAGFKLFFPQNKLVLEHIVKSDDYKKIVLSRENLLAAYSSARSVQVAGQKKIFKGETPKSVKIIFIPDDFELYCNRINKYVGLGVDLLKKFNVKYLPLEYSEIASNYPFNNILDFLEMDNTVTLESAVIKRNSNTILDRFENPEEVFSYMNKINKMHWIDNEIK